MGLLDFVKSAGAKLLGKDDEKEIEKEAKAGAKGDDQVERLREELRRKRLVANLKKQLAAHGLEIADPHITYDGETVSIRGTVASQEVREKIVLTAGNVAGVASVEDQITVDNPEPEAVFYTVVRGDTLSKIAKEHYGSANKYPKIFEANRPMLSDPDKIYPGQVLRIPPLEG